MQATPGLDEIREHSDARSFLAAASDYLSEREAFNNVLLGVASAVADGVRFGDMPPVFLTAHRDAAIVGALTWTPPFRASLSHVDARTCQVFARWLAAQPTRPSGVVLAAERVSGFVEHFGHAPTQQILSRAFELRQLKRPTVPGSARLAGRDDLAMVRTWVLAFQEEAMPHEPAVDRSAEWIDAGKVWLWLDPSGQPVSLAIRNRELPRGASVGPVYTPKDARRHGYGSAVTAAVSEHILASGEDYCCLFTDLSNPTSNAIYQRLGYKAIGDVTMLEFGD